MYENLHGDSESGVDTANSQAETFESYSNGANTGVTVNGGEFGSPIMARKNPFSNKNPGRYQTRYHYDRQATFDFLAVRGVGHVRIPFRWERLQPRLGRPLDDAEVGRIKKVIRRARGLDR
jgi:endoglucanase